jgi:hypothetical protein
LKQLSRSAGLGLLEILLGSAIAKALEKTIRRSNGSRELIATPENQEDFIQREGMFTMMPEFRITNIITTAPTRIERAPTYYGQMSLAVDSKDAAGDLVAQIDMPRRQTPRRLLVRFRHPQGKPIQSVTVNGAKRYCQMLWMEFFPDQHRSSVADQFHLFISPTSKARFSKALTLVLAQYLASAGR